MTTMTGKDIERHEEIKQKAWEIYQKMYIAGLNNNQAHAKHLPIIRQAAWERAEEFYNFAKEKENSNNENKCAHCGKLFEEQQICYSLDTKGNKFCSKKCVLENLEQEEADDGDK